jgi:hypothetical protein
MLADILKLIRNNEKEFNVHIKDTLGSHLINNDKPQLGNIETINDVILQTISLLDDSTNKKEDLKKYNYLL